MDQMSNRIVVAGATGNLGKRIVKTLLERGATVIALVRTGGGDEKVDGLKLLGARWRLSMSQTSTRSQRLARVQIA